jgi:hypothetical protein
MPAPPVTAARQIIETVLKDLAARYGLPEGAMPTLEPEVHTALIDAMSKSGIHNHRHLGVGVFVHKRQHGFVQLLEAGRCATFGRQI